MSIKRALLLLVALVLWWTPVDAQDDSRYEMAFVADVGPDVMAGSQPTTSDLAALAAAGVVVIIDLRAPGEPRGFDEAAVAAEIGLRYVNIPIDGADAVNGENAAKLDAALRTAGGKSLVHCASSNRAGALLALRAAAAGASVEAAIETGKRAGMTSLESTVRARMAASEPGPGPQ